MEIFKKRTETEVPSIKCTCVSRLPRLGSIISSSCRSAEKQFPQYSLQDVPADQARSASSFVVPRFSIYLFTYFFSFSSSFSPVVDYRIHLSKKIFLLESLFPPGRALPRPRSIQASTKVFLTTNIYFYQSIVCLWRDTLKTI